MVGVAEAVERVGQEVAIADGRIQVDRVPVTGDGAFVVGEPAMGTTEAVPGGGLAELVTNLLKYDECFFACDEGLSVVAEQSVCKADSVERPSLPDKAAGDAKKLQGPLVVPQGIVRTALGFGKLGQAGVYVRYARLVTEIGVQVNRVPVKRLGLVESARPGVAEGESA